MTPPRLACLVESAGFRTSDDLASPEPLLPPPPSLPPHAASMTAPRPVAPVAASARRRERRLLLRIRSQYSADITLPCLARFDCGQAKVGPERSQSKCAGCEPLAAAMWRISPAA